MSEVTLREYFDVQLKNLREHCQRELRAVEMRLDREYRAGQIALDLQAKEYERRLEGLNNSQARIDRIVNEKVDRREWSESHTRVVDTANALKEQMATDRARAISLSEAKAKAFALLYSAIGLLVSLASITVAYIIHR